MRELLEYRKNLIDRLVGAAREFRAECLEARDVYTPLESGGWNIHQVAVHTRDVNRLVYGLRARRTAAEDNPEFQNFDGDAHMAGYYSEKEPLDDILNGLVEEVEGMVEMLRGLIPQAWSRESRHETLGRGFTLQGWVEKGLAHIEEHLEDLRQRKET